MEMKLINNLNDLEYYENDWAKLLKSSEYRMIFQTFLWNKKIVESFNRENQMKIFCFTKNDELVAIAPLRKTVRNLKVAKYDVITFLTHNRADCQDFVGTNYLKEALQMLVGYLLSNDISWNLIYLRNIPATSKTSGVLTALLDDNNISYLVRDGISCPTVPIVSPFDDYAATLKKKMLSNLRRCENRLREQGKVEIQKYDGEVDIKFITDEFISLHMKRWSVTSTPSKFNRKLHRAYYLSLFQELYDNDQLELFYLKFEGKVIAFHFGSKFNNHVLSHTPCFDPEFSKFSPSKILLFYVLKDAFERGCSEFNFLAGAEEYKSEWAKNVEKTNSIYIFRNSLSKVLYNVFFDDFKYNRFKWIKRNI